MFSRTMEMFSFEASFMLLATICLLLFLFTANSTKQPSSGNVFRGFQRLYLTVFLMAQGKWYQNFISYPFLCRWVICGTTDDMNKKDATRRFPSVSFLFKVVPTYSVCLVCLKIPVVRWHLKTEIKKEKGNRPLYIFVPRKGLGKLYKF